MNFFVKLLFWLALVFMAFQGGRVLGYKEGKIDALNPTTSINIPQPPADMINGI